jgi:hypothetical protein
VNRPHTEAPLIRKLSTAGPLLVALGAAVLIAPAASSAAGTPCTPKKTTIAGKAAMRFCGPAKATVKMGTARFTFSGGSCATLGQYFTVNIGTHWITSVAGTKPGPSAYFGITLSPPATGTHLKQPVSWNSGGKGYSVLRSKITLNKGLTSGSFSGKALNGSKVTGVFTCQ